MTPEQEQIADLKRRADARRGKPGFTRNVAALDAEIERLEKLTFRYRDKESGEFVTAEYAVANPDETERVEI